MERSCAMEISETHYLTPTGQKRKLSDKDKIWLETYFETCNASEAARAAGYENAVRQHGYLMRQKLSGFLQTKIRSMIGHCSPAALETVYHLSQESGDDKVRLAAAQDLLNRAGYAQAQKVEVTVADKSDAELDSEIQRLLKKGNIIDAEVV